MKLSRFLGALVVSCSTTVLAVCLLAPDPSRDSTGAALAEENEPRSTMPEDRRAPRAVTLPETSFRIGGPVSLTARSSKEARSDERLVLFEASADATTEVKAAPVNLAIVMDRSGSMRGPRIENAKRAAQAAISKLRAGDRLAVVTFDTTAERVFVGEINETSRAEAARAIEGIRLGGDTCISCGLDVALPWLASSDGVRRVVLLSDGDANNGVRDLVGFRGLGERAAKSAATITSVGLDVHYNEKILSALSEASNGRHIFSDRAEDLAAVFGDEAARLAASVADQAEVRFTLPRSVELVSVADRAFTRDGNLVRVALGAFSRGEKKTILVRLRSRAVDTEGLATDFRYVEAAGGREVFMSATLGLTTQDDLDPAVTERAARSDAAAALRDANELMEAGRFDEARARLGAARTAIAASASAPSMATATAVASDFNRQLETLQRAEQALPPPTSTAPSSSRAVQSQKKKNWTASRELGL